MHPCNKYLTQMRINHAGAIVRIGTQGFSKCNECHEAFRTLQFEAILIALSIMGKGHGQRRVLFQEREKQDGVGRGAPDHSLLTTSPSCL
eukprot:1146663-Pelagomonas_calceolata.AAC.5